MRRGLFIFAVAVLAAALPGAIAGLRALGPSTNGAPHPSLDRSDTRVLDALPPGSDQIASEPTNEEDTSFPRIAPVARSGSSQSPDALDVFVSEESGDSSYAIRGAVAQLTLSSDVPTKSDNSQQQTTDIAGHARFSGLADGQAYTLSVTASGYGTVTKQFIKTPGHQDLPIVVFKNPSTSP